MLNTTCLCVTRWFPQPSLAFARLCSELFLSCRRRAPAVFANTALGCSVKNLFSSGVVGGLENGKRDGENRS